MKLYLLIGCPGSGKSYVADRLKEAMDYIPHDNFIKTGQSYLSHITSHMKSRESKKPVLIETPFSVSQIKEPLERQGIKVECVYIQEKQGVIENRYLARDGKPIPPGHLTRQETYKQRAHESGSFFGTSDQVVDFLKNEAKQSPEGET